MDITKAQAGSCVQFVDRDGVLESVEAGGVVTAAGELLLMESTEDRSWRQESCKAYDRIIYPGERLIS